MISHPRRSSPEAAIKYAERDRGPIGTNWASRKPVKSSRQGPLDLSTEAK